MPIIVCLFQVRNSIFNVLYFVFYISQLKIYCPVSALTYFILNFQLDINQSIKVETSSISQFLNNNIFCLIFNRRYLLINIQKEVVPCTHYHSMAIQSYFVKKYIDKEITCLNDTQSSEFLISLSWQMNIFSLDLDSSFPAALNSAISLPTKFFLFTEFVNQNFIDEG